MASFRVVLVLLATVPLVLAVDQTTPQKSNETAPTVPTKPPIVPTEIICKECDCTGSTIDCNEKDIDKFYSIADWLGVKPLNPSNIILTNNELTVVTPFSDLPVLSLNLSHNYINIIERASFKMLQALRELDLSYNNLTASTLNPHVFEGQYAPEEYQPLRSLRILRLSYNQLHALDPDVFEHTPELEELYMDGNPLTVIDHVTVVAISSLMSLKVLNLANCQLKSLPEFFLHTPQQLKHLDLSENALTSVPMALEDARVLEYLSLSQNPIRFIGGDSETSRSFPKMPGLKEVFICHMPKLEAIHDHGMSGLQSLQKLYLHHNPALSFISPTALQQKDDEGEGQNWPILSELYIGHNNLSTLDNTFIGRWDLLKTIDIRENPYLCDCSTQWMISTLAPLIISSSPNLTSDIICREPIEMRGKSLIHLEEIHRHMRCSDTYGGRPERDTALLIGTFIGVLVTVPMVLGILLLHRRGYFAACGLRGPAAFSRAFYKRTGTDEFT